MWKGDEDATSWRVRCVVFSRPIVARLLARRDLRNEAIFIFVSVSESGFLSPMGGLKVGRLIDRSMDSLGALRVLWQMVAISYSSEMNC